MKRCSMLARVRMACRAMSWEAMPYTTSLNPRRKPRSPFGSLSGSIAQTSLHLDQIEFFFVQRVPLPQHAPLPCIEVPRDVRKQPQRVRRRHDGHPDHVPEAHQHEQDVQLAAHVRGLAGEFVTRHAEKELADGATQPLYVHDRSPHTLYEAGAAARTTGCAR